MPITPEKLFDILERPADDRNYLLHELLVEQLHEQTAGEPDFVTINVKFEISKDDYNRYRACNRAHLDYTPQRALVDMIQECLYDGGPLAEGLFTIEEVAADAT